MSTKWAIRDVVADHFATFTDARSGRLYAPDFLAMLGLPLGAAGIVIVTRTHLASLGELLAGVGVFTAGLLALLVQIFPTALRVTDDPRLAGNRRISVLVDELEANTSYAVLTGLVCSALLMAAAATSGPAADIWWSAVIAAFLLHLVLTTLMVLKRVRAVYRELR